MLGWLHPSIEVLFKERKKERKKENNVSAAAQDDDGRHLGFGWKWVHKNWECEEEAKMSLVFFDFELLNAIPVDCVKDDVTIV